MDFAQAYALTVAIETAALYAMLRKGYASPLIIRNSLIANTITHPLVWFAFPLLWPKIGWAATTASAELSAFAAEAAFYRFLFPGLGWRKAAAASFVCNALSFSAGLALDYLIFSRG